MATLNIRLPGGTIETIPLVNTNTRPALHIRGGGFDGNLALIQPSDTRASHLRVKVNNMVYAVQKDYSTTPPTPPPVNPPTNNNPKLLSRFALTSYINRPGGWTTYGKPQTKFYGESYTRFGVPSSGEILLMPTRGVSHFSYFTSGSSDKYARTSDLMSFKDSSGKATPVVVVNLNQWGGRLKGAAFWGTTSGGELILLYGDGTSYRHSNGVTYDAIAWRGIAISFRGGYSVSLPGGTPAMDVLVFDKPFFDWSNLRWIQY